MSEVKVERAVEIDAPSDVVWDALTDPDQLSGWFGGRVALDAVPGGAGRFEDEDGEIRRARVDDVEPCRRLSFRWWAEDDDDGPITTVTFELIESAVGTRVVVTEEALLVGRMEASASAGAGSAASALLARLDRRWADVLERLGHWTSALVCV
jgi:uncharacterized protein YndB with AHSA1/START domain